VPRTTVDVERILFCAAAAESASSARASLPHASVVHSHRWPEVLSSARAFDALVLLLDASQAWPQRLRELRLAHPGLPCVLIGDSTCVDADPIWSNIPAATWKRELGGAVASVRTDCLLRDLAKSIDSSPSLANGPQLREALVHAFLSAIPPAAVGDVAALAGCSQSNLERQWRNVFDGSPPIRLEDALGHLVLIRALALRSRGLGWKKVAGQCDLHSETLRRMAVRLTGRKLAPLAAGGPVAQCARFADDVVARITGRT